MTESRSINDLTTEEVREIGNTIKELSENDTIAITSHLLNEYITGTITETTEEDGYYGRILTTSDGTRYEIYANWRDIPADSGDQETPYTGLIEEPFNDTSPPVTGLKVLD